MGPFALNLLTLKVTAEVLRTLAELSLALVLFTDAALGKAVVGEMFGSLNWRVFVYAVFSLTLVGILPVFAVLAGMGMRASEKLFIGMK